MPRTQAPIDEATIAQAIRFDATIFLGTGRYHTGSFDNLPDAREAARQFGDVARNGRKGMVYAVTAVGRSIFVPEDFQPASKGLIAMTDTNLTGSQIAQLTAMLTGGGYKRANSRDAAAKRFRKIAAEAGIAEASIETYLAGPFDLAEHCIREHKAGRAMTIAEVHGMRPEAKAEPVAIDDPAVADHPAAKANAASWDAIPSIASARKRGARKAAIDAAKGTEPPAATEKAPKAEKPAGKRAAILGAAEAGELPPVPDFSAETHKRFRPKLAQVVAMVEAGDIAGLEAFPINPISSSPKAIAKYRDLAVIALKARKGEAA